MGEFLDVKDYLAVFIMRNFDTTCVANDTMICKAIYSHFPNCRLMNKEHSLILPSAVWEPTYGSREIIYPEGTAFFLPKASPLTV